MVAVGAVIRDEAERVLVVKHVPEREGYWKGKWICPGGRLERGETIAEGILREVQEETHLKIELVEPLLPFERIVKEGENTTLHVVYIDYLAKVVGGALQPDSDVGEAVWMTKEEVRERWEEFHADTQILMEKAGIL